jgi:hypothetical protein
MSFLCDACDAEISAPYEWGGVSLPCPQCAQPVVLEHRTGRPIAPSASGYGISFADFRRLITVQGWREQAQPVIAALLSCSVREQDGGFALVEQGGALIPYEVAHLIIQANPAHRRRLYGVAMDLWR